MKIREMYDYCIANEERVMGHYILCCLQESRLTLEDDVAQLPHCDAQKVQDMVKKNVLGFSTIKIFSLKKNKTTFVFIFASDAQQAIHFFKKVYHHKPLSCHDYPLDYPMARGNAYLTFLEMRKEFIDFPTLVGVYERR